MQVSRIGSPAAHREAARIRTDARKQLYRLLSEDEDSSEDPPTTRPAAHARVQSLAADRNRMVSPSGDQIGKVSKAASWVSWTTPVPSARIT